jgi:hypothetical protein
MVATTTVNERHVLTVHYTSSQPLLSIDHHSDISTMAKAKVTRKADKSSKSEDMQRGTGEVRRIVLDQLISDLAAGKVGDASFPLSETQKTLKIDRSIVYLSTLCFVELDDMGPTHSNNENVDTIISSRLHERFETFQRIYHGALAKQGRNIESQIFKSDVLFELSPRLCPFTEQLVMVLRDLKVATVNLTRLAQQAAEDLLNESNEESIVHPGKRAQQTNKKRPSKSKPVTYCKAECVSTHMDEQRQPIQETQTLEELLRNRYVSENPESSSNYDFPSTSWIEVSKIKNKNHASKLPAISSIVQVLESSAQLSVGELTTPESPDAGEIIETKVLGASTITDVEAFERVPATIDRDSCSANIAQPSVGELTTPESPEAGEMIETKMPGASTVAGVRAFEKTPAITDRDKCSAIVQERPQSPSCLSPDIFNTSYENQKKRIRDLEASMDEMKLEHAKTLQNERQRCDDLIQSLQLRLYISETRLKAYEEALWTHIQAVTTNVSGGGQPSSSDRIIVATVAGDEVSSPRSLISKALQKNSAQNETRIETMSGDGMGGSCSFFS